MTHKDAMWDGLPRFSARLFHVLTEAYSAFLK